MKIDKIINKNSWFIIKTVLKYKYINEKLKEVALGGLNEMKVLNNISDAVKYKLRKEGLTKY